MRLFKNSLKITRKAKQMIEQANVNQFMVYILSAKS